MGIDLHLSTCVDTQSPKYLEMAQRAHFPFSSVAPRLAVLSRKLDELRRARPPFSGAPWPPFSHASSASSVARSPSSVARACRPSTPPSRRSPSSVTCARRPSTPPSFPAVSLPVSLLPHLQFCVLKLCVWSKFRVLSIEFWLMIIMLLEEKVTR
jgi:hypothetical protein